MDFISVRDFRLKPGEIWKKLKKQDLVVTLNGKPVAIMTPVDGDNLEQAMVLLSRLRAQMAVSRMRQNAAALGVDRLTDAEIEEEIRQARSEAGS